MRLAVGILSLLGLVAGAWAQSDRGTIAGSIVDSTGAAISGAAITITGADTGNVYKTVSSSYGVYRVGDVQIGRYNITVQAPGFKVSQQQGVLVQINTTAALNITLEPGNVQESVTVNADSPTLQTESSDIGTVVDNKQIEDLPLALNATGQSFVRSPESFVFLTPGTAGPGTNSDHASAGVYESKLSGGQNFGTEILLDGVSVVRSDSGAAFDQTAPTVEALTEFKVTTATPSAEFGRTSGGIESFTTKTGTNRFHGSVFELFRNEALDAFSWNTDFANAQIRQSNVGCSGTSCTPLNPKPRDRQNDFGGSLGGPVRIPHLYNGHDKTFFFFAWEQYRNRRGLSNNILTLPTAAERGGDFSALLGAPATVTNNGVTTPVINPCNGQQVLTGQIFDPSTTQVVGGQTCRLPFAGNIITNTSAVAEKVLGYLPTPNLIGTPANGVAGLIGNYQNPTSLDHVVTTETSFRIDEDLTNRNKMFFSYSSREQNYLNGNNFDLPAPLTPGNYYNYYFTHYLRFGYDFLASSSLLNHFTVGLNRVYTAAQAPSVNGTNWDQTLGITGASGEVFPQFQFAGSPYGIGYSGLSDANFGVQVPNSLVVADGVSWTKGRHALRFGFEWRSYQYSVENNSNTSPQFNFSANETSFAPSTQQPGANLTGDPFASFLLGTPDQEQLTVNSHSPRWNQNYYALYAQDDFKATHNLNVNLGLRWDVDTPRHEATGAQAVFSPALPNALTPGQSGALAYGKSATGAQTFFKDFGPRIGFAYSPSYLPKTVIRGGYSIYYAALTYSDFGSSLTSGTTANPNFKNTDNFTPVQNLDAGFPAYTAPSNTQDPTLNTFTQNSIYYSAPQYGKPGMVQNWDVEFQHQIAQDLILSIGYVGQHATRLLSNLAQTNTPNPKYNYLGAGLQDLVTDPAGQAILTSLGISVPSWFVPGWSPSSNDKVGQLLRPFPQYGNITSNCCLENLGQSTYNALEAKLERRFRNGLNLLASYTFSKTITDADSAFSTETGFNSNVFGAQNPYNLKGEKAVSYQDIPQTFVLSYLYELPVGPGKRYLTHGVASKILGGWQINGIQRYQAGSPTVINEYASANPFSTGNYRYSLIGAPFPAHPGHWTPALNSTWNSGCVEGGNGVFGPASTTAPATVNCSSFENPSDTSVPFGGGYIFGNLPTVVSWWRSPGYKNEDFSIIKRTTIRENQAIMFKLDIPNAFNRHVFGSIDGNPGDSFFGVPGGGGHSVINAPRTLQATLRYEF
jgi:hypothetical protein